MSTRVKWSIWIPVIICLITSLTTIAVTYINANSKANKLNEIYKYRQIAQKRINAPIDNHRAMVQMSMKGFVVVTETNK